MLLALLWVWRVSRQQLTGRGGADTMVVAGVKDRATGRGRASVVERVVLQLQGCDVRMDHLWQAPYRVPHHAQR